MSRRQPAEDPFEDFLSSPPLGAGTGARSGNTHGSQHDVFENMGDNERRNMDPFFDEYVPKLTLSREPSSADTAYCAT
jgi:hypothetical protein